MYLYHNRIKQRINNGELMGYTFAKSYNKIKEPVMIIHFNTEPAKRPIRMKKWDTYLQLINKQAMNVFIVYYYDIAADDIQQTQIEGMSEKRIRRMFEEEYPGFELIEIQRIR